MNQKYLFPILIFTIVFQTQCKKSSTQNSNPKDKLAALKAQSKDIEEQIANLEMEILKSDPSAAQIVKAKKISVDTIKKSNFKHFIEAQGTVDAKQNVLVAPQMPGVISAIHVKEGDYVNAGKVLASLDVSAMRKGLDELHSGIALATTMYEKQKKLWDQNIGSEAQYLQAKNQKEQLELKLQTLQAQISTATIKSPISGIVDEIKVKIGEVASPGFTGIRVVNGKELTVRAKISDLYITKVKKGDIVDLYFPDFEKSFQTKVQYVGQTVNSASRTFMVETGLPNTKERVVANQIVKIKIKDKEIKNAVVVSTNFIQKSIDGEDYILVAEKSSDDKWYARKKLIKSGAEYDGRTIIESGIKEGDLIISFGYSEIVDGQLIQI
ncbi:MAG: efflux RND transporter periplasmic adaptor subunit [Saprospiraceae bacterium]|nr:efflux RND transporter periplasmic adaptor subunit [Saprospiraceae bacterium]